MTATAQGEAALHNAGMRIPVFPVFGVEEGKCACGRYPCGPDNRSAGKHPIPSNGFHAATTDRDQVDRWWKEHPTANIGTPAFDAVDYDEYKDGAKDAFARLKSLIPKTTPQTRTGGGGRQFLFKPGTLARGNLGIGIDSRFANANYIILPPSRHRSGGTYEWTLTLAEGRLAPAPDFPLSENAGGEDDNLRDRVHDGELIETGRNKAAFRFACMAARWSDDPELVEQQTQAWVDRYCRNPEEVDTAKQVAGALKLSETESLAQAVQSGTTSIPDLATLLAETEKFYRRFIVMTDAQFVAVTLWTVHTHAVDAAEATPYIHTTSPTKKAGKSRLLDVASLLVRAPLSTGGATEAALFRSIGGKVTPTVLWDELDSVFGPKSPENEGRRGILNNGYTRNKPYLRCVGEGSKQKVEKFAVFCPKMLCGIGSVPDTIADRSLPIHLKRKTRSEKVERFRERAAKLEAAPLREQLTAWADEHVDELAEAHPRLPEELDDRAQDVVEPLLALADAAGGEWPVRVRKALIEIRGGQDQGDEPDAIRLLTDIRTVSSGRENMLTSELLNALFRIDTSPWAHWWGETRRGEFGETIIEPSRGGAMKLARTLRPFGVRPATIGGRAKGYQMVDFDEAFERYLAAPETASPPYSGPEVVQVVQTQQASQKSDVSRSSNDASWTTSEEPVSGSTTPNRRPGRPRTPDKGKSECKHPVRWLARDGKRRCMNCEPPAFPGEIVPEATSADNGATCACGAPIPRGSGNTATKCGTCATANITYSDGGVS